MSEPRPSHGSSLPSAQHIGTGRIPVPAATAHNASVIGNDQALSLTEPQDTNDGYSPTTVDSSGRGSSVDQRSLPGSSPQSRTVHGKIACQECVSESLHVAVMFEICC
jgi:hypothetical protein